MNSVAIAVFIGGLLQPYVQELLLRNKLNGRSALAATVGASLFIAVVATWVVGGFAGVHLPAISLADPSPLLQYLMPYFTAVFTLSQLVFHGSEATPADPHAVVGTEATPAPIPAPLPPAPTGSAPDA